MKFNIGDRVAKYRVEPGDSPKVIRESGEIITVGREYSLATEKYLRLKLDDGRECDATESQCRRLKKRCSRIWVNPVALKVPRRGLLFSTVEAKGWIPFVQERL